MILSDSWQRTDTNELVEILQPDQNILALAVFGSAVAPIKGLDIWSDLDCLIVASDESVTNYFPDIDWLSSLGTVYTKAQSSNEFYKTTRICFSDMRRLDLIIATASDLQRINDWPRNPISRGCNSEFSKEPWIEEILSKTDWVNKQYISPDDSSKVLLNDFWYKGVLGVYKVMRNDLLIALHLALDMAQDCCVLGMKLRDRSEGTQHHKEGGAVNDIVQQLMSNQQPFNAPGILDLIEQSCSVFDSLAVEWSDDYEEKRFPLLELINLAREGVGKAS